MTGEELTGSEGLVVAVYKDFRVLIFMMDREWKGLGKRSAGEPWATDTFIVAGALRGPGNCGGLMVPYDFKDARDSRRPKKGEVYKSGLFEDWGPSTTCCRWRRGEGCPASVAADGALQQLDKKKIQPT